METQDIVCSGGIKLPTPGSGYAALSSNSDSAMATMFQKLIRTGVITIAPEADAVEEEEEE